MGLETCGARQRRGWPAGFRRWLARPLCGAIVLALVVTVGNAAQATIVTQTFNYTGSIDWGILASWLACIAFCIAFYVGLVIFLMTVIAAIQLPSVYH